MKSRVRKWGNSLALRIPKSFAVEARLREDTPVEWSLIDGKLIIQPIAQSQCTLKELLQEITDENLHGEWDTGPAAGREAW